MGKKWYKFLGKDYSGGFTAFSWWPYLPSPEGRPGLDTLPAEGPLQACKNGYHLTRGAGVLSYAAEYAYEAEPVGAEVLEINHAGTGPKLCCRSARLLRRVAGWTPERIHEFRLELMREALGRYNDALYRKVSPLLAVADGRFSDEGYKYSDAIRGIYYQYTDVIEEELSGKSIPNALRALYNAVFYTLPHAGVGAAIIAGAELSGWAPTINSLYGEARLAEFLSHVGMEG
jgi:hypothetical protein